MNALFSFPWCLNSPPYDNLEEWMLISSLETNLYLPVNIISFMKIVSYRPPRITFLNAIISFFFG